MEVLPVLFKASNFCYKTSRTLLRVRKQYPWSLFFQVWGVLKLKRTVSTEQIDLAEGREIDTSSGDLCCNTFSQHDPSQLPLRCLGGTATFSEEQAMVLDAISQGKSVFLTGAAGTGKTLLLTRAVELLRSMYGSEAVCVTASTGLAACNLGGTTLHSLVGIDAGRETKQRLARAVWSNSWRRKVWLKAKVLVIDEISTIDSSTFENIEYVGRMLRGSTLDGNARVFGGLQLLVAGDFFQLPPVSGNKFAFEASCWEKCFDLEISLNSVFRQQDVEFVNILNELRMGQCSPESTRKLRSCERPLPDDGSGVCATKLYPLKVETRRRNEEQLKALGEEIITFVAEDNVASQCAQAWLKKFVVEQNLPLSVGAQVMLIRNASVTAGLVNGARGIVVGFAVGQDAIARSFENRISPNQLWPVVRFASHGIERVIRPEFWKIDLGGHLLASRWQVPLTLAWALNVHKCQGMTLDKAEVHLSQVFSYGMAYVALSRVKSFDWLHLSGFDPSKVQVHPKVFEYYRKFG